jgi:hypothetical protein
MLAVYGVEWGNGSVSELHYLIDVFANDPALSSELQRDAKHEIDFA